jgi:hypothetical protein
MIMENTNSEVRRTDPDATTNRLSDSDAVGDLISDGALPRGVVPGATVEFRLGNGVVVQGEVKPGQVHDYGHAFAHSPVYPVKTTGEREGEHVAHRDIQLRFGSGSQDARFRERHTRDVDGHIWKVTPSATVRVVESPSDALEGPVVLADEGENGGGD